MEYRETWKDVALDSMLFILKYSMVLMLGMQIGRDFLR